MLVPSNRHPRESGGPGASDREVALGSRLRGNDGSNWSSLDLRQGDLADRRGHRFGVLDLRVVGGARNRVKAGVRQGGGQLLAIGGGGGPHLFAPPQQGGAGGSGEPNFPPRGEELRVSAGERRGAPFAPRAPHPRGLGRGG